MEKNEEGGRGTHVLLPCRNKGGRERRGDREIFFLMPRLRESCRLRNRDRVGPAILERCIEPMAW